MLTVNEIERRKPVWIHISEFYLDTELGVNDLKRIALVFNKSGYSLLELKNINYYEVAPIIHPWYTMGTDNWSGFDPNWLNNEIINKLKGGGYKPLLRKYHVSRIDRFTDRYWERIVQIENIKS